MNKNIATKFISIATIASFALSRGRYFCYTRAAV